MNWECFYKALPNIPTGKIGAEVIAENGQKGIIHRGQTNENGDHYVYPYKNEFKPEIREYKIINYF